MQNSEKIQVQAITYTYWSWDKTSGRNLPITIVAGQDGVSVEHVITLNEFEHAAKLSKRYEYDNRDFDTENKKVRYKNSFDDSICDPIENLGTRKTEPAFCFEQDLEEPNPLVEELLTLMENLTPRQIDLIYDLFGSRRQLTEIAQEEGVSVAAIHNRKSKIIARLRKLFNEQGNL